MKFRWLHLLAGISVLLTSAQVWGICNNPAVPCDRFAPGDFDGDGDVDMDDFAILQGCINGKAPVGFDCALADLNGDGRTDDTDFGAWQQVYTGACDCGPDLREPPQPAPAEPFRSETPVALPAMPDTKPVHSIYLSTGEFYLAAEDLRIKGRGLDFVWARKYRSRSGPHTAMGQGWDFSYNIRIEKAGPHIRLFDGNTRSDVYYRQANGTWSRPELFRTLALGEDGGYVLVFADTSRWTFRQFDGTPAAGRIAQIVDRNGNALRFVYDSSGRLIQIDDTLGRPITVAYNRAGYIASVTDFTGRRISYEYYQPEDADGSTGDLKSASGPTPADSNESQAEQITTYTYSQGYNDTRLNHNLLSITDARGHTFLQNVYSDEPDRADSLLFDRVVRQVWGAAGDNVDMVYVPQAPAAANNFATVKAIVNDRAGNVHEYYYDARHRLGMSRDLTGRADPDQPTTDTENRPAGKLRPDDPEAFTAWYEYNVDSLCTRVVTPNGGEEQFVYDSGNPSPRSRGNLLRHVRLPGALGGDQARIVESFEYDSAGCCGTNQLTKSVDPRGGKTLHSYDAHGNRVRTQQAIASVVDEYEYNEYGQRVAHVLPAGSNGQRRRDEFTYYAAGLQHGYLESEIVDAANLALTTTHEYDALGRCIRTISPAGRETLFAYDALDHLIRETSPELTSGSGVRPQRDLTYDAASNLVRVDVQNTDDRGRAAAEGTISTWYEYDVLSRLTRQIQKVDAERSIATEYLYDANGNRILVRQGEATAGRQTANTIRTLYDERDLPYRVIRAEGDAAQTTTQYDYDGDRNVVHVRDGIEDRADHSTTYAYDGYGRLVRETDAMSNVKTTRYDAAGHVLGRRVEGELVDVPGDAGNVRLSEETSEYDALGRLTRKAVELFNAKSQAATGRGRTVTRYEYNGESQLTVQIDDNDGQWSYTYDTAGRKRTSVDPRGNGTAYAYDADSNVVRETGLEKSDSESADVTTATNYQYDAVGHLIRWKDATGRGESYAYNSRGLKVASVDARGNETRYEYDGLGRLIRTIRDMNGNGASASDTQDIVTGQSWDDSSRLIARTDGNGNTTSYGYDAADRMIAIRYADGTSAAITRDVHGNAVSTTDPNGTAVNTSYDLLNRIARKDIKRAAGVHGPSAEQYGYDGLSRIVGANSEDSAVSFQYDSLSNVTRESQQVVPSGPSRMVTAAYDGVGNCTRLVYPNGRTIAISYDRVNRPTAIRDETSGAASGIATYRYAGDHVEGCDLGNGTRIAIEYDAAHRTGTTRVVAATGAVLDERSYALDPTGNLLKLQMTPADGGQNRSVSSDRETGSAAVGRAYTYDAICRLVQSQTMPDDLRIAYRLDRAGNRTQVEGGPDAGTYAMQNDLPEPADLQANQYSSVAGQARTYDRNGNLKTSHNNQRRYGYDYQNRLIDFTDVGASLSVMYKYDCLGRRIEKNAGGVITRYYYFGRLNLEEQNQSHITAASYVYGPGLGASAPEKMSDWVPLQVLRPGQSYWYAGDTLGNTVKLMSATGSVVEQYLYSDYGRCDFANSAGAPLPASAVGNPWLFSGMRLDPETGFYYEYYSSVPPIVRSRYFEPLTGRYISRDPAGLWGNPANLGNPFTFRGNNPLRR